MNQPSAAQATSAIQDAADRLSAAEQTRKPCAPVRDLIGADGARAYEVQRRNVERRKQRGARVVGAKIGLTSPAVQRQLGVDQPDFGILFDDMEVSGAATIDSTRLLQPRIEAEVAFILKSDLDGPNLDAGSARAAVDYAVPALEIVDSRVESWDITFVDTVADNASSCMYVLGAQRRSLDSFEPREVTMEMTVDGAMASSGSGIDCLGDPLEALAWLARTMRDLGTPLRKDQVVLSGALGPMVTVHPGMTAVANINGLGTVSASFGIGEKP
ncbi:MULTISPECIES: fumarylacetoacetate hydrolase family protein [unclassified Nocardioides]|uniref:2-keto-4-pentenoate hydratase n=1 Tax=unclassified Nocardioides TaxID=2615069 RepID=UPI0000571263|nr:MULTISPECIES: fumarylacetoacetate hydrolase family protein [unclassified Nocardioides]ABL81660.1 4-oxalocrotonate decarboxylase [Nocardioides sp. JS614]